MKIQLYKIDQLNEQAKQTAIQAMRDELNDKRSTPEIIRTKWRDYKTDDSVVCSYANWTLSLFDENGKLKAGEDWSEVDESLMLDMGN